MLAKCDASSSIECGLPFRADGFWHHQGNIDHGAA